MAQPRLSRAAQVARSPSEASNTQTPSSQIITGCFGDREFDGTDSQLCKLK